MIRVRPNCDIWYCPISDTNVRYELEVWTWGTKLRNELDASTWGTNCFSVILRITMKQGDVAFAFTRSFVQFSFFPLLLLLRFSLSILLVFQMGTLFWVSIPTNPFPDCLWQRLGKSTKRCTHVQLGEEITMKTLAKLIMHREFAKTMKTRKFSIKMDSHSVRFYHFLSHFEI